MTSDRFSFGSFRFDAAQALLLRDGEPVPLGRRGGLLLAALLRRRGEVVPRSALIDAAWPGEAVEESNLSVQMAQLRKRIGAEWIRTVERVGYQFVQRPVSDPPYQVPEIGLPGLAILPFADLSLEGRHQRLADGFVEDLTTALSRFKTLLVAARNASFRFDGRAADVRRAAQDLGVRYVLEGSIRCARDRVRISVQLIDGVTGTHVWADTYDQGRPDDVIDAVSATVEAQIHAAEIARSRHSRPESMEAYDLYLRARGRLQTSRPDDNLAAFALFKRALALEPENPLFVAGAAETIHHRTVVGWRPLGSDDRRQVRELGQRGLDLVDRDAVTMALIGNALFTAREEDLGAATTARAVGLNAGSPQALICQAHTNVWAGSIDTAEALYKRSLRLNPTDVNQRFALGGMSLIACLRDDFEEALVWTNRAHAFAPGYSTPYWNAIAAYAHLGRMKEARHHLARYRAISPDVTIASIRSGQPYRDPSRLKPILDGLRIAGLPEH